MTDAEASIAYDKHVDVNVFDKKFLVISVCVTSSWGENWVASFSVSLTNMIIFNCFLHVENYVNMKINWMF